MSRIVPTRKTVIISLLLLLAVQPVAAQKNITVRGHANGATGRKVEILKCADQISRLEVVADSATIDSNGRFQLRLYANYPMLVSMRIENYSQAFYVEPAKEYEVEIPTFDWNMDEKRNIFLDPEPLPLLFQNLGSDDINLQIDSIDRVIARFLDENRTYIDQRFRPSPLFFDSLALVLNRQCPDGSSDFVNRYKHYQLAELKYNLKFDSRKSLVDKYIKNQPILYNDENYMSLFASVYAYSISKGTKKISVYRLAHWVYNLDLETYIDSIGTDPLLRHEQVRELAALQALQESYYNFHYYDPEMVVKMIERLAQRTKFPDHKAIARNILEGLNKSRTEENSDLLDNMVLPDVNKQPFDLKQLKGKWIYVSFVRAGDPGSLAELETMAHLYNQVKAENKDVEFVSIDCSREFQKMFHFLKNSKHGNRYNWTWLHFDGNYDLLRRFQITTQPWFVLINPEGKLQYDITPAPSTGFLLNAPWKQQRQEEESSNNPLFRR